MTIVTRSTRRSSPYYPVPSNLADRQSVKSDAPAVRSPIGRVTLLLSGICRTRTTSKERPEIDARNPFIPSLNPTCRVVDQMLLFWVALAGLAAAGVVLIKQVIS